MLSGDVIYGGNLELCHTDDTSDTWSMTGIDFLYKVSDPKLDTTEIGSDSVAVCFCEDGIFDSDCLNTSRSITVKRGEMFNISLIAVGQLNIPVPASILANSDADRGRVQLYPQFPETDGTCIDVGVKVMSEQESISRTLYLYPDGPCGNTAQTSLSIQISLADCPPGFELTGDSCVAVNRDCVI